MFVLPNWVLESLAGNAFFLEREGVGIQHAGT